MRPIIWIDNPNHSPHARRARGGTVAESRGHFQKSRLRAVLVPLVALVLHPTCPSPASGAPLRTNEPVYQNPFDLAAGGASLTRATQEGVLFTNPSLTAFGSGFLRWIYGRTAYHVGADAVDLATEIVSGRSDSGADAALFQRALSTPVHVGMDLSVGVITSNLGFAVFSAARADLEGRQFGSQGLPEIRVRSQATGGVALSGAKQFGDVLALGVAAKPLYNAEVDEKIALSDFQDTEAAQQKAVAALKEGFGLSVDTGLTLQKRTRNFDVRFAAVLADVGGTAFKEGIPPWRQTLNVGVGLALHDATQVVHCAVDLRDALAAYEEHWTRRTYAGCKAIMTKYFGLAAGLHQGWPTYGLILNLFVMRLEAGSYTKEVGLEAGTQGRRVYFLAMGFEIP